MERERISSAEEAQKPTNGALLVRLDERTQTIVKELDSMNRRMESGLVTRAEFAPVRNLVYGATGLILLAVVGAMVALVLQK